MEVAGSLQTSVHIYQNTRCHIPEGIIVNIYLPENFKNITLLKLFRKILKIDTRFYNISDPVSCACLVTDAISFDMKHLT